MNSRSESAKADFVAARPLRREFTRRPFQRGPRIARSQTWTRLGPVFRVCASGSGNTGRKWHKCCWLKGDLKGGQVADLDHCYMPTNAVGYVLWNRLTGGANPERLDQNRPNPGANSGANADANAEGAGAQDTPNLWASRVGESRGRVA